MIREATPSDIPDIIEMAMMVLEENDTPGMVVNRQKVSLIVRQCVQSKRHFVLVSEKNGVMSGVLGALVTPDLFHDGYQATVLMWYGHGGAEMMKRFVAWADEAPGIIMTTYTTEPGTNIKAIGRLLRRLGFDGGISMFTRMRAAA